MIVAGNGFGTGFKMDAAGFFSVGNTMKAI